RLFSPGRYRSAEETSREGESSRSDTKTASSRGCHDTRGRASREQSPPMRSPCICRPCEKAGKETDWQGRLSSRTRLVGCKGSIECSRTLETASCRCSTEWPGPRTAHARTKVPHALLECGCSQNRKWNETARSYKRRSEARGLLVRLGIG